MPTSLRSLPRTVMTTPIWMPIREFSPDDPNGMRPNSWERIPTELFPYLNGDRGLTDTDWQDAIFRTAGTQSHNISVSGRGKTVGYFVSANYYDKEGVVINSDFKKYSMRMNLDGSTKDSSSGLISLRPTRLPIVWTHQVQAVLYSLR